MKVRLTRGVTLLTLLTVAVAVGLLYRSWDSQTSTWESGVFVQFGSTLLLFVPLAVLTYSIETGLDRVSRRQDQIATRQEGVPPVYGRNGPLVSGVAGRPGKAALGLLVLARPNRRSAHRHRDRLPRARHELGPELAHDHGIQSGEWS